MNFEAIVLAGGLGTRLRKVVPDLPKALAPVAGQPFIDFLLHSLAASGCQRVVIAVGYRCELIVEHVGSKFAGLDVAYSIEDEPLGTGGATRKALSAIESSRAVVLNADTWLEIHYPAMLDAHCDAAARVTMAVREVADVGRYGAVDVEARRVVRFEEKGVRRGPGLINAGAYVFEQDVFDDVRLPDAFSLEVDFLTPCVARLAPLAFPVRGAFVDIGVPDDYVLAQSLLASVVRSGPKGQG